MKFGKILVSIYQPGSAAILNSIPGLEVIEGLGIMQCQELVFLSRPKDSRRKGRR